MQARRIRGRWWAAGLVLASMTASVPALAQGKGPPAAAPAKGAPAASAKAAPAAPAKGAPAAPAKAAPAAPAGATDAEKEAEKLHKAGAEAAKAARWEEARELMLKSFQMKPTSQHAVELGGVELKADKPRDAAEHLTYALREAQGISDDDRKATEKMLAEAKSKIGTVTVVVEAGAEVLVDGKSVGTAPLPGPVFVEAGSRRFEAKKEGVTLPSQEVQVAAGSAPVVELKLASKEGTAGVGMPAGAGTSPMTGAGPTAGTGAATGAGPKAGVVAGTAQGSGAASGKSPPDATEGGPNKTLLYVSIGVNAGLGVLAIGTAIGAGVKDAASQARLDRGGGKAACNAKADCTSEYNSLQRQGSALATVSMVSALGAMALGVGTAVYAMMGSRSQKPQVSMAVTPQGGGVTFNMGF